MKPTAPKRPRPGSGWRPIPVPPTLPAGSEAWARRQLVALSSLADMEAPDGSGDVLPTWLVSVSRAGASMPSDRDLGRARRDFGMRSAEEDNHQDGRARMLFLVVDPARRVDCECKADERVVVRPDGFRYSIPADEAPRA